MNLIQGVIPSRLIGIGISLNTPDHLKKGELKVLGEIPINRDGMTP
jgi:hypothetical protein